MISLIEARDVHRRFHTGDGGDIAALRGASLAIEPGEMVAIMGPSGCGKSTLLSILGGLDRATSGKVWFAGQRVDGFSEGQWAKHRRQHIGFVFQFFNLVENFTAADNVKFPALIGGASAREAKARRVALLERLHLSDRASLLPSRLAGGERQRVALARALVNRPDVLLADEPTGSLDSVASAEVLALLREMHREGQSIVLVTHDSRVAAAADRTLHMRDGVVVGEGVAASAAAEPLFARGRA